MGNSWLSKALIGAFEPPADRFAGSVRFRCNDIQGRPHLTTPQNEVITAIPNMFSMVLLPWKFTSRM
jgi:hypothetical protein